MKRSFAALTVNYHTVVNVFHLQGVPPLLGEGAQVVPLVTDALAAGVDCGSIVIVQLTGGDSRGKRGTEDYVNYIRVADHLLKLLLTFLPQISGAHIKIFKPITGFFFSI